MLKISAEVSAKVLASAGDGCVVPAAAVGDTAFKVVDVIAFQASKFVLLLILPRIAGVHDDGIS